MSGPFGSSQWMYQSARDFYEFPIEQSLKFNDDDSSYLSRTPSTSGNRQTWTLSVWIKRCLLGSRQYIIEGYQDADDFTGINFNPSDQLELYTIVNNVDYAYRTDDVFRDTSAWYHFVFVFDSTNATASERFKIYVNGVAASVVVTDGPMPQNWNSYINHTVPQNLFRRQYFSNLYSDLYASEINLIDGQALDASSFGEFKSGVWIPKDPSGLTYGTNGFRLSFQNDTVSEGFNTVTYTGNDAQRSITGLGFSPDLVWTKYRSAVGAHTLMDSIRGASARLFSNLTNAEAASNGLISFDADGFTMGDNATSHNMNGNGVSFVAWCWDAGSGSPVSNTDGSITSTVKANAAYGMSIISYTGNGSTGATVGHGLSSAPEMIIVKNRDISDNWAVYHSGIGATHGLNLNATTAAFDWDRYWNDTAPTSSVFTVGGPIVDAQVNGNGNDIIAYAFHSVAGYSKVGSYSGSGSAGNAVTTGFKPAWVMIKRTDGGTNGWMIYDDTRDVTNDRTARLKANASDAEDTGDAVSFDANGFTLNATGASVNTSGATYIYLAFADTRDNAFWRDQSGNGNDWQPNNLTYQDSLPDSTTNNFAVLNPLANAGSTFSEGNLQISFGNDGSYNPPVETGTISIPSSGKYYFEAVLTSATAMGVGIQANTDVKVRRGSVDYGVYYVDSGNIYTYVNGSGTIVDSTPATFTTGDVIGVAYDADTNSISWYKNGTLQTSYTPSTGHEFTPAYYAYASTVRANFGQDSSFAGNKPAQGNTDDNGIGDFFYAPPSGYLALAALNLPNPTIDPAQDDVPSDYFNTVTWTGNGTTDRDIPVGFGSDFVWIKQRSGTEHHQLFDLIRGANARLCSSGTFAEDATNTERLKAFITNGFTIGNDIAVNNSGSTYVAWNWLAGNGTSSNTDGSITSTVSVNQKAGFSVVSYVGNGSTNQTVGHGLGVKPSIVIYKDRDAATAWRVIPTFINDGHYLALNNTDAIYTGSTAFFGTNTSSVLGISGSSSGIINASGNDIIAYCFAEIPSYSSFGKYTGNGSADGPFIFCGFEPAVILLKSSSVTGGWEILDNARDPYNVAQKLLQPNVSNAEASSANHAVDFLSNGFKIRTSGGSDPAINTNGSTVIYAAWASNPFKYANAR